jgi:alpha-1,2-mannosyltransferase
MAAMARRAGAAWAVTGLAVAAVAVWVTWRELGPGASNAIDLAVYRDAGYVILHGGSPYAASFGRQPPSYPLRYPLPFTYPPVAAVLAVPLTLLGPRPLGWVWDLGSVLVLGAVVFGAARFLVERLGPGPQEPALSGEPGSTRWWATPRAALTVGAVVVVCLLSRPLRDDLMFGQVDVVLMGACLADVVSRHRRWPQGLLIGLATAVQVAPGIFVVYLLCTRRWAALRTAVVTWVLATAAGAVVLPGPSVQYFTSLLFDSSRVGNVAYFSNQSLWGIFARADLGPWHGPTLGLALVAVAGCGLGGAAAVARHDPTPWGTWRSALLVGLTWTLVSPVSWIHGMVWLLPAGVVAVAATPPRWRLLVAAVLAVPLCARLPHVDRRPSLVHLPGVVVAAMVDVYGILAAVLLVALAGQAWSSWRRRAHGGVQPRPWGTVHSTARWRASAPSSASGLSARPTAKVVRLSSPSTASTSTSGPVNRSAWSAAAARASRPSSTSPAGSTAPTRAR